MRSPSTPRARDALAGAALALALAASAFADASVSERSAPGRSSDRPPAALTLDPPRRASAPPKATSAQPSPAPAPASRGAGGEPRAFGPREGARRAADAAAPRADPAARVHRAIELPAHAALMRAIASSDGGPEPFVGDGCSGGLSATWRALAALSPDFAQTHDARPPWEPCCDAHDRAYHDASGADAPDESYDARLAADETLRACVIGTAERRAPALRALYGFAEEDAEALYRAIAGAMFNAVRSGGGPCTGLPWRWGFGYPRCAVPSSRPGPPEPPASRVKQ